MESSLAAPSYSPYPHHSTSLRMRSIGPALLRRTHRQGSGTITSVVATDWPRYDVVIQTSCDLDQRTPRSPSISRSGFSPPLCVLRTFRSVSQDWVIPPEN